MKRKKKKTEFQGFLRVVFKLTQKKKKFAVDQGLLKWAILVIKGF